MEKKEWIDLDDYKEVFISDERMKEILETIINGFKDD
jgi:hypothetical protein